MAHHMEHLCYPKIWNGGRKTTVFFFFFFLARLCGMWEHSSLTRD